MGDIAEAGAFSTPGLSAPCAPEALPAQSPGPCGPSPTRRCDLTGGPRSFRAQRAQLAPAVDHMPATRACALAWSHRIGAKERLVPRGFSKLLYLNSKQTKAERRGDSEPVRPPADPKPWPEGAGRLVPEQRLAHAVPGRRAQRPPWRRRDGGGRRGRGARR